MANSRYIIFSVDTEPDSMWTRSRIDHTFTHESLAGVIVLFPLLKRYGIKPTLLLSHSIAASDNAANLLLKASQQHTTEIGTHFHTCDTPPFTGLLEEKTDNILFLGTDILEEKFQNLHDIITSRFGKPSSFRAGAWTIDNRLLSLLIKNTYSVDSSVTPGISWSLIGRPSYLTASQSPYFADENNVTKPGTSPILEVPVSLWPQHRGFFRMPGILASPLTMPLASQKYLPLKYISFIKKVRPLWLRPAFKSLDEMKLITIPLLVKTGYVHIMIHSNELTTHTSPYTRTRQDREQLFAKMEAFFKYCLDLGCTPVTLSEYAEILKKEVKTVPDDQPAAPATVTTTGSQPIPTIIQTKEVSKKNRQPRIHQIVRWILSIGILIALLFKVDFPELWNTMKTIHPGFLSIAMCMALVNQILCAAKLTQVLSIHAVKFPAVLRYTFISSFFNFFLPTSIGGDIVRIMYVNNDIKSKTVSIAAITFDKTINIVVQLIVVLSCISFLSGPLFSVHQKAGTAITGFALVLLLSLLFIIIRKGALSDGFDFIFSRFSQDYSIRIKLRSFFKSLFLKPQKTATIICIALVYNLSNISIVLIMAKAFNCNLHFFEAALLIFAGSIGTALPISVAGIGVVEGIYTVLFNIFNNNKEIGFAVSIGMRLAMLLPVVLGWILFHTHPRIKPE